MIAIDTNVLVRYLVGDDRKQAEIAREFLEDQLTADQPGFISVVTVAELYWVLKSRYGVAVPLIHDYIAELMTAPQLVFDRPDEVQAALKSSHRALADALIHALGAAAGCERTVTFDREFARLDGVEMLHAK